MCMHQLVARRAALLACLLIPASVQGSTITVTTAADDLTVNGNC